jgi:hypothetical protein
MKRIYKFNLILIEKEHEINEWLAAQPNVAVAYSYERTSGGDIVSIFEVDFLDANVALIFDLKFSDADSRNRY